MIRRIAVIALLCSSPLLGNDQQIAEKFVPVELIATDTTTSCVPMNTDGVGLILAAYCDGERGAIAIISAADGGTLLAQSVPSSMFGLAVSVALQDLDGDGKPEIIASVRQARGLAVDWLYRWTGTTLELLGPLDPGTGNNDASSDLTDISVVDIDGDGIQEIIDHKLFQQTDDYGVESFASMYTVCHAGDSSVSAGAPLDFFARFERGTGAPLPVASLFTVSDSSARELILVNDPNAHGAVVSSALVSINGAEVLHPSDLNEHVMRVRLPVPVVVGENTINVTLRGSPGAQVAILIRRAQ